jgi:hypothetical protein
MSVDEKEVGFKLQMISKRNALFKRYCKWCPPLQMYEEQAPASDQQVESRTLTIHNQRSGSMDSYTR